MDIHGLRRGGGLSWFRSIVLAIVLVLAVAACGPDETDRTTTSPTTGAGPLTASPDAVTSAVLIFDTETCRNSGTVEAFGVVWELVDTVPLAWQETGEQEGSLTIVDDQHATFTANDGTQLQVTIGPHEEECFGWDDDEG